MLGYLPGLSKKVVVLSDEDLLVLDEKGNEVELKENVEYGDTDYRSIMEGDRRGTNERDGNKLSST